jgi:EAL domain-containing protein (putative c-di-GMP-specific phosphodiesterase class I)
MTKITDTFTREHFDAGETIFSLGDPGTSAYVIEQGSVEVLKGEGENLQRVATLAQGAMFGEVALLDHQPRTATVRAMESTSLIRIDSGHVEELLQRADPVIQYLLRLLLVRFRSTSALDPNHTGTLPPRVDRESETALVKDLHTAAVRTLLLAKDLSDALEGSQLELFYQPLIALDGLIPIGYEALIRWRHPTLGMINPMEFIPLAEKTGLIHRIGQWVLNRATQDWNELRQLCHHHAGQAPFMSINLAASELGAPGIVESIRSCLQNTGMPPAELRIELTETTLINNMAAMEVTLADLRELGVDIALDDFGTGYAGLDYLQTLPFSCLKVDKSFVQQLNTSDRSFHIVQSALELAHSLGLSTVAEGIEDCDIANRLRAMGCTYAQGYNFGRPMPKADIAAWSAAFTLKHGHR